MGHVIKKTEITKIYDGKIVNLEVVLDFSEGIGYNGYGVYIEYPDMDSNTSTNSFGDGELAQNLAEHFYNATVNYIRACTEENLPEWNEDYINFEFGEMGEGSNLIGVLKFISKYA